MEKCMSTYGKLACDDEPSEQELQQESLAGASFYEYEQACIAEKEEQEHQQYMYVLSLGE
jgi:hypothetical protein